MFKFASRLSLGALLVTTVACGGYEDEDWDTWDEPGSLDLIELDAEQAALRGQFGPLTALGRATSVSGWEDSYFTTIEVRDDSLERGGASAFTMVDVMDGLLQSAVPGTVYYNDTFSSGDKALIDDAGDSYVRIDDDTEVVQSDDVDAMVCSDGRTSDGVDAAYDEPAEEVMLQVEVLDTYERPAATEPGDEERGETAGDDQIDATPETDQVELIEVRVTALVLDVDDFGEPTGSQRVVNTRFVMER